MVSDGIVSSRDRLRTCNQSRYKMGSESLEIVHILDNDDEMPHANDDSISCSFDHSHSNPNRHDSPRSLEQKLAHSKSEVQE